MCVCYCLQVSNYTSNYQSIGITWLLEPAFVILFFWFRSSLNTIFVFCLTETVSRWHFDVRLVNACQLQANHNDFALKKDRLKWAFLFSLFPLPLSIFIFSPDDWSICRVQLNGHYSSADQVDEWHRATATSFALCPCTLHFSPPWLRLLCPTEKFLLL